MITVLPVDQYDVPALATIRRDAFAATVISQLISGPVDPAKRLESGIRNLSNMLHRPRRTLRKAIRDESDNEFVGMSIFDLVDTTLEVAAAEDGAPADSASQDRPEPTPGTNLERLNELVTMLQGLLEQYKKYDRGGAGSALLEDLLAQVDAADLPCYLESTLLAEPLYRRFGFVDFGGKVSCGPDGAMILQPMRRPAKSERANPTGLRIFPAEEDDVVALAHMHNVAFADDTFMRLIWGDVTDRASFDRALAKDFSRRRVCVHKALAPGFKDPVGMTLAFVVDTRREGREQSRSEEVEGSQQPQQQPAQEEHLPGTDVTLFKEFMTMLERVRAAYRKRDPRFYHLEILAVAPEAQRKGIGRALLEDVLAKADRENLPVYLEASAGEFLARFCGNRLPRGVYIDRWADRTAVGTQLYRQHGFVECAERASCGSNNAISVLPMRRPAPADRA
ncbi:hypothetical protein JCM3774_004363 [Rhodotorula dairenensis]